MGDGNYGRHGTLGLATPQANPTAETEFRALMPQGVASATVRMAVKSLIPGLDCAAILSISLKHWPASIRLRCKP